VGQSHLIMTLNVCKVAVPDSKLQVLDACGPHEGTQLPSRKRAAEVSGALADITNQPEQKRAALGSKLGPVKPDRLPGVAGKATVVTVCGTDVELCELYHTEVAAMDPQRVSEYLADIYEKLGRDEKVCATGCLANAWPHDWDEKTRAAVVDLLVGVQVQFVLRSETLFLAVSLLDRFLKAKPVKCEDVQLVGIAAMFTAAKFEEIDPPDVQDFVHVTAQACSTEKIFEMEVVMLNTLGFGLCCPTAPHFVERYQHADRHSEVHKHLIQYSLELSLLDAQMTKYSPSHQAAAAALVSSSMLHIRPIWHADVARQAEAAEPSVRRCARDMCVLLQTASSSPHQSVREKFMKEEYHRVAKMSL